LAIYKFSIQVIKNGGGAGRMHWSFSAFDDPEINLNYQRAETLTFFAKEATSVVNRLPGWIFPCRHNRTGTTLG